MDRRRDRCGNINVGTEYVVLLRIGRMGIVVPMVTSSMLGLGAKWSHVRA